MLLQTGAHAHSPLLGAKCATKHLVPIVWYQGLGTTSSSKRLPTAIDGVIIATDFFCSIFHYVSRHANYAMHKHIYIYIYMPALSPIR